jgi:small subunit ribosomal protein S4
MHHWRKGKISEYGRRLREKQKAKRYYGLYEGQFKEYFKAAERQKGNSGTNLMVLLERRLDNVVYRGGFAYSHRHARQIIGHGHIAVNGKTVDIASYLVKVGDVITSLGRESSQKLIKDILQNVRVDPPSWIEHVSEPASLKVASSPIREDIPIDIDEQLIVEFFSR